MPTFSTQKARNGLPIGAGNKSNKMYLSTDEQRLIMQFLQVRLDQSRRGADKMCYGLTATERRNLRGQIAWFEAEQSVIKRLMSTVGHHIGINE